MRLIPLVLAVTTTAAPFDAGADGPRGHEAAALRDPTRLRLRAHVVKVGVFGLTADTTVADADRRDGASFDDVPVVEVRGARVRIVHDEDDARMLLWLDQRDLGWAITRDTRVAGKGDVGVWLLRGAPVEVTGGGARRRVAARLGPALSATVRGVVSASALGRVYERPAPTPATAGGRGAPALLDAPDGQPLLATPDGLAVREVAAGSGAWRLVEHRSRWLRVRGWVQAHELTDELGTLGTGSGGGYGMSHARRVAVAAGACLHARPGGPVVGIQLTDGSRYTPGDEDGWWELYVGNAWGLFTVHARAARTDASGEPVFAPCR